MKSGVPWSVKGIEPQAREAAKDAAQRAGLTLGQWLNQMILERDSGTAGAPQDGHRPAPSSEQLARRLYALNRHFDAISEEAARPEAPAMPAPEPGAQARAADHHNPPPGVSPRDPVGEQIQLRLQRTDANVKLLQGEVAQIAESLRTHAPMSTAGIQALERALYEVVDHIELTDQRSAEALKTIQARLSDLANRSPGAAGSGEDRESRQAILKLEQRLGDLARRVEHAEHSDNATGNSALEQKLAELAGKVDRARNNPAVEAIEARLSQVTSKLSAAERTMTPLSEFKQVKSEIGKLRSDVSRAHDPVKPVVVHAIEARLKSLDSEMSAIRSSAASGTDLKRLGERLEAVVQRLNGSEDALRSVERIGSFEAQLDSIGRRLEESLNHRAAHPQISALEAKVGEIAGRLDSAGEQTGAMPAITDLERQVNEISSRLDATENQFSVLDSIERNLAQLFNSIDASRQAAIDAAEQAAFNAVHGMTSRSAGSDEIAPSEALAALERALADVKNQAAAADKHNQETLEAIHDTLKRIIERVGKLETAGPAVAELGDRTAAEPVFPSSLRPESDAAPEDFGDFRLPPLEDADEDNPAQASSAAPSPASGDEPGAFDSAPDGGSTGFSRAYDVPEPAQSHNEDFIAAARKAARAASEALDALDPSTETDTEEGRSTKSVIGRFRNRKRALLFAAAVIFITAGTISVTGILDKPFAVFGGKPADTGAAPSDAVAVPADAAEEPASPDAAQSNRLNVFTGETSTASRNRGDAPAQSKPAVKLAAPASGTTAGSQAGAEEEPLVAATPVITIAPPREQPRETVLSPSAGDNAQSSPARAIRADAPAASAHRAGSLAGSEPAGQEQLAAVAISIDPLPRSVLAAPAPVDEAGPRTLMAAAEAGDAAAQFEIAARYTDGRAGRRDDAEAAIWYQRAAAQGLAPAQYRLGALYEKGQGVPQDTSAAQIWYQRAAEQGNVKAMHNLGVLLAGGTGTGADYARAARWFLKASELGLADSQYNLAVLHERGLGIEHDLGAAYKWFAIAAAKGDAGAEKRMNALAGEIDPATLARASAAYQAWRAAPLDRAANFVEPAGIVDVEAGANSAPSPTNLVARAQELLAELGYDAGSADGVAGPRTRDAIRAFERERGLPVTGNATPSVIEHLESAAAG